jgi:hypothetical protein
MPDESYKTELWNRSGEHRRVYEGSQILMILKLNEKILIESINPLSTYARFDQVIWEPSGSAYVHERPGWVEPDRGSRWVTEFINLDGRETEERLVDGRFVTLPKGIPFRVGVNLNDPYILAAQVRIERVREKIKSEKFPGYFSYEEKLRDVIVERGEMELKILSKLLVSDVIGESKQ